MKKKRKRKSLFKNKKQMIIYLAIFVLIIIAFIYLGSKNYDVDPLDNERFAEEFSGFTKENVFVYTKPNDIYENLDKSTIILFGSNQNEWTEPLAQLVNDVVKERNIDEVTYYDIFNDRFNSNGNYELIVNELSNYLYTSDDGSKDIFAPTLLVIKNGEIIFVYDETSIIKGNITPEKYWTENKKGEFSATFNTVIDEYIEVSNG